MATPDHDDTSISTTFPSKLNPPMSSPKVSSAWYSPSIPNRLGESPIFRDSDSTLHWVDCFSNPPALYIISVSEAGEPVGEARIVPLNDVITVIYFRKDHPGSYICATTDGLAFLDEKTGLIEPVQTTTISPEFRGRIRINDAFVDSKGRIWLGEVDVGAMQYGAGNVPEDYETKGRLMRYDPDGDLQVVDQNALLCGNGIAISPDEKTLYIVDTCIRAIYAYDLDFETGNVSNKRKFVEFEGNIEPDGMVRDSEGNLWIAFYPVGKIRKVDPDGKTLQDVELPAQRITCPTWGGKDYKTMYITTAAGDLAGPAPEGDLGGRILSFKPDGAGGLPRYKFGA